MFATLTNLSVQLVNRYLPSPFVFSVVLTFIAFIAGIVFDGSIPFGIGSSLGQWLVVAS